MPSVLAASAAGMRSTSHKISVARCRAGRCCSAVTNASLIVSRATAMSARSPCSASMGGEAGPRSIGVGRRCRLRSMSTQMLVAIRYSHDRMLERPSNPSAARQARSMVSCTASSASDPEPSMR